MKSFILFFSILILLLSGCASTRSKRPQLRFDQEPVAPAPDYARADAWAALPDKKDNADRVPDPTRLKDEQTGAQVDVFFLHPTTYTYHKGNIHWNADIQNQALNDKTDKGTILNQASVFNGAGKIYAPRYRQAHIEAFWTTDTVSANQAFEIAYSDIKTAFEYFLKHYNKNRPIIIAAHSQGTRHAGRLLREYFDGKPLQNRLVVAYIVGLPVTKQYFQNILPCETPEQTGCFCTWRTFERGFYPAIHKQGNDIVVTNPLTWKTDTTYAPATLNQGAVFLKFNKLQPKMVDAQVHDGLLWIKKPSFIGSSLIKTHNFHVGDYNMFYMNIRENAKYRVQLFWK
jgi:Protein of unknown function (DUF3089)